MTLSVVGSECQVGTAETAPGRTVRTSSSPSQVIQSELGDTGGALDVWSAPLARIGAYAVLRSHAACVLALRKRENLTSQCPS